MNTDKHDMHSWFYPCLSVFIREPNVFSDVLAWNPTPWTATRSCARAAEFVAEWAGWGAVVVLGPVREAADEVALAACGDALVGVHRLAFRELVGELSAGERNRRALVPVGRTVR